VLARRNAREHGLFLGALTRHLAELSLVMTDGNRRYHELRRARGRWREHIYTRRDVRPMWWW
jgi:hypothetical protein